jgi:transposase InsO family protein
VSSPHICGIPEVLYTDNGTDFTSKHLEQVAADLKIRLVFSIPGKPQGRGRVERFFRTVNEMFLCDLDGYTRRSRRKPSLTLGQFEDLFRTFLLEVYHVLRGQRAPSHLSELQINDATRQLREATLDEVSRHDLRVKGDI